MSEERPQHPREPAEGAEEAEEAAGVERAGEDDGGMQEGGEETSVEHPQEPAEGAEKRPRRPLVPIEPQRGARALAVRCLLPGSEKVVARVRGKERESGADRLGDGGRSLGTPNRGAS